MIGSYYTKGKCGQGYEDKVIYFVLNIVLIRKCFFTSAYFFPFDLKSSVKQKLSSLKEKVCFCD